jgi:putative SOS response-associated peptidase YedK
MCGKASYKGNLYIPGIKIPVLTKTGQIEITWGNRGYYNARAERINELYKQIKENKCLMLVDRFYEKNHLITWDESFYLAGLYNSKENFFLILTCPASRAISPVHHRMPVIIAVGEENLYFKDEINLLNPFSNLKVA